MFQIWKKSLDVQYLVESTVILAIAIIWLFVSNFVVQKENDINNLTTSLANLQSSGASQSQIDSNTSSLLHSSEDYLQYLNFLIVIGCVTFAYLLKDLEEHMYCGLRGVYISHFTIKILLDSLNVVVVIYWLIYHFTYFVSDTSNMGAIEKASTVKNRMATAKFFEIRYTLSILSAIQLTRLVFSLQVSRTFGPMVKILFSMMKELIIFLFLYVLLFLIFASTGQLLFQELKEFSNIGQSSKTLFASSLGNFSYDLFDTITVTPPEVGYIFLTIFLLFTAVMLLNFLIAILSNTYAELNVVKNALYLRKVIQLRQRYDYDRCYSGIVFSTPPFNLLSLIFTPFLAYKKSRKLNRIVLIVQYIWIGIASIIVFSIASLFMLPLSYLAILIHKIRVIPARPFSGC